MRAGRRTIEILVFNEGLSISPYARIPVLSAGQALSEHTVTLSEFEGFGWWAVGVEGVTRGRFFGFAQNDRGRGAQNAK